MTPTDVDDSLRLVEAFHHAFNGGDIEALMRLIADDCVFENTRPPPDGERFVGRVAVRSAWEAFFRRSPEAHFDIEEMFAAGDRCVVRWRYTWVRDGAPGHVRGVDIFRIRDGRIREKLSYVKG